jgi:ABC-type glycerol-3-phosphate transport system permease component
MRLKESKINWFSTGKVIVYALLILVAVVNLFPFYWAVLSAFKFNGDIIKNPPIFFTLHLTLDNFRRVFLDRYDIYYRNSIVQVSLALPLLLFFSSLGGYIFSKFKFRGKDLLFKSILSTMMLPFAVLMIPMVIITGKMGLINNLLGLVIPFFISPFGIFMVRQYMETIPNEMLDAARVDGASYWKIYTTIMLPLSKPILNTLAIFFFLGNWNSYLWPLVTMFNEENWTLPIGAAQFGQKFGAQYGPTLAVSIIMMLPLVVMFLIFQKGIVEGFALTGLKG